MKNKAVKRTERGWAGHFICADRCLFRRNTLLECGDVRIVVSTVGLLVDINYRKLPNSRKFTEIGINRHFETMAFHATLEHKRYWEADVNRQISFESPWSIAELDADDKANDMHEAVVDEITAELMKGNKYE